LKNVHPNSFDETKSNFNETTDRSIQNISRLTEKVQNKNVSKGENFCNECDVKLKKYNFSSTINVIDAGINLIETEGLINFGASYYKEAVGDADDACLNEALWKCGHYSIRYFNENDCVVHQLLLHSATFYCIVCSREFQGLSVLSKYLQHMKNKHSEFFPNILYTCSSSKLEFLTIYEKLAYQKVCDLKKLK